MRHACATCQGKKAVLQGIRYDHPHLSQKLGIPVYGVRMAHAGYAHRFDNPASITLREGLIPFLVHPTISRHTANAMFIAAHEMGHVALQSDDETKVNNYARAHFRLFARRIGLTPEQAQALLRLNPY